MNRIYRLVWNRRLGSYVVAAETAAACGKKRAGVRSGRAVMAVAVLALGTAANAGPAAGVVPPGALPGGAHVSAGSVTVHSSGSTMTVQETSTAAAIDWQSFTVGSHATVNFVQPGTSAVILNRVVGGQAALVDGTLNANGQVFLIDSSGVLIGKGARINAAGFVASTLDESDADLLAGKRTFTRTGATGSVINLGTITARDGGYVALLGQQVVNGGVISARLGTAALAAGDRISLNFQGDSLVGVAVDRGTLAGLVANRAAVYADGGTVILTAQGLDTVLAASVNNTGLVRAQTIGKVPGHIYLLGDAQDATVHAGGTLDASAPDGGAGGFIETSAAHVQMAPDLSVTTAARSGLTGSWLIDPVDFTIAASGGDITGAQLSADLVNTSVSLASASGAHGTAGNLNVNDAVSWTRNKLTLTAANDVNINATLTASNTAQLDLEPGSGNVNFGFGPGGAFLGQVNFFQADGVTPRAGTGFLTISGHGYTVITSLGQAGDATTAPATMTLQGLAAVAPVTMGGYSAIPGYYALGANINASATAGWHGGAGFTPIGVGNYTEAFGGSFDGLGHVVSNLTINQPQAVGVGLFPFVIGTNGGFIRNVGLTGVSVTAQGQVGALVGYGYGAGGTLAISNAYSTGTVNVPAGATSNGATGGGLVGGLVFGTLTNGHSSAAVSVSGYGNSNGGGLVGYVYNSTITNSYATGNVTNVGVTSLRSGSYAGTNTITGGLVGFSSYGTIRNSFATGNVSANRNGVGGLVGYNYGSVTNCYSTGNVSSGSTGSFGSSAGGLIGFQNYAGTVSNSYETGLVTATSGGAPVVTGALVGMLGNGATVTNSYWNLANGTTGTLVFSGSANVSGAAGLTTAQMMSQASYAPSGSGTGQWDFASTWFIYQGSTTPLLRSFLTPLTVSAGGSVTYNGSAQGGALSYSTAADPSHILGTAAIAGGTHVGTYATSVSGLYSDQLGYLLTMAGGSVTILPATLTYLATPATQAAGSGNTNFTGTVTGFVGGDSLASATTGVAHFTSTASPASSAGRYAIDGSGLSAENGDYVFVQAAANATALTLTGPAGGSGGSPGGAGDEGLLNAEAAALLQTRNRPPQDPGAPDTAAQTTVPGDAGFTVPGLPAGTPLALVPVPAGGEPDAVISLSQARGLLQGGASPDGNSPVGNDGSLAQDVRVPVSRTSLAEIVNGGVRLPSGVDQQLFVVAK